MKQSILILFFTLMSANVSAKLDSSADVFFPPSLGKKLKSYQSTPLSWWNFILFDSEKINRQEVCDNLQDSQTLFLFNPCQVLPFSPDWLKDLALFQLLNSPPPSTKEELKQKLDRAVLQLSLPLPKESLEVVRQSPLTDFQKFGDSFTEFFAKQTPPGRWQVIPLLLNFPPGTNQQSLDSIPQSERMRGVGPHFGSMANKQTIIKDLKWVIGLGGFLVSLFLTWLFVTGRRPYLLLLPIIASSMGLAYLVTVFVFGSLHGLTLAFGGGLIGISMDYAFHGWQKKYSSKIWRSIFIGFLTSFSAFFLLSFFSTPLIRQLSLFSMTGLSGAFLGIWWLSKSRFFESSIKPVEIQVPHFARTPTLVIISLLTVAGLISALFIKQDFSLRSMDITLAKMDSTLESLNQAKDQWHFVFTDKGDQKQIKELADWSESQEISSLNLNVFKPFGIIKRNQWKPLLCDPSSFWHQLSAQVPYSKLFKNFFESLQCKTLDLNIVSPMLEIFAGPSHYISILKSETPEQALKIAERYSNQFQLSEITTTFPQVMRDEIRLFLLIIVFLSLGLLSYFFGNKAAFVLLPALGGFASILIFHWIFDLSLSFISFVSMIILLGLTIDYGVYCVSHLKWKEPLASAHGAVALSAATSLAGFSPLAFCDHPVLRDLGVTLTCGLIGALVVCFFVYPQLDKRTYG